MGNFKLLLVAIVITSCSGGKNIDDYFFYRTSAKCTSDSIVSTKDYSPKIEHNRVKEGEEFVIEHYPKNGYYAVKYGGQYLEYSYGEFRLKGFWFAHKCKTKQQAINLIDKYVEQNMKKGVTYELYTPIKYGH